MLVTYRGPQLTTQRPKTAPSKWQLKMVPPVQMSDGTVLEQAFSEMSTYDATLGNVGLNWLALLALAAAYLGLALWLQKRKDVV